MYQIVIQLAADNAIVPKRSLLRKWAKAALANQTASKKVETAEVTIRLVTTSEMSALNESYRHKNGPTNVLSFPFSMPMEIDMEIPLLGDIVICPDVVYQEAEEQGKSSEAHFAHMIVHGIFHLLGYDHENDRDASIMESLEIEVMQTLGFSNPYETGEKIKT